MRYVLTLTVRYFCLHVNITYFASCIEVLASDPPKLVSGRLWFDVLSAAEPYLSLTGSLWTSYSLCHSQLPITHQCIVFSLDKYNHFSELY